MIQRGFRNTVDWVDREPRKAALLNVGVAVVQGMLLGLVMGLFASLVTSGLPKVWTYATNAFGVMLIRLVLQWLWVLKVTRWAYNLAMWLFRQKTGLDVPMGIGKQPGGTTQVNTLIAPAIVAVAIATILATEQLNPSWLNVTWAIVSISALGGAVASLMEGLSLPSNIYALRWNRHQYQETLGYQEAANRHHKTRRGRR